MAYKPNRGKWSGNQYNYDGDSYATHGYMYYNNNPQVQSIYMDRPHLRMSNLSMPKPRAIEMYMQKNKLRFDQFFVINKYPDEYFYFDRMLGLRRAKESDPGISKSILWQLLVGRYFILNKPSNKRGGFPMTGPMSEISNTAKGELAVKYYDNKGESTSFIIVPDVLAYVFNGVQVGVRRYEPNPIWLVLVKRDGTEIVVNMFDATKLRPWVDPLLPQVDNTYDTGNFKVPMGQTFSVKAGKVWKVVGYDPLTDMYVTIDESLSHNLRDHRARTLFTEEEIVKALHMISDGDARIQDGEIAIIPADMYGGARRVIFHYLASGKILVLAENDVREIQKNATRALVRSFYPTIWFNN